MQRKNILANSLLLGLLATSITHATLIDRGIIGQGGNPAGEAQAIINADLLGIGTDPLTYLAKFEFDEAEWDSDGLFDNNKFGATDYTGNPATTTLTWDLTGTGYTLEAVAVKAATLMRIYAVADDQKLMDLNGQAGVSPWRDEISHVTFFGRTGNTPPPPGVPDTGSTLLLLGLGLGFLGFLKRQK